MFRRKKIFPIVFFFFCTRREDETEVGYNHNKMRMDARLLTFPSTKEKQTNKKE